MAADYSCVDATRLDRFLVSIDPYFSVYTYKLLDIGVDSNTLPQLSEEMLRHECQIVNPIHRMKLFHWMEGENHYLQFALYSYTVQVAKCVLRCNLYALQRNHFCANNLKICKICKNVHL